MSDSNASTRTETTSNLSYLDKRIGVEGYGNDFIGDGGYGYEFGNSGLYGVSAPISTGSTYSDTGDVFAPSFQFSGGEQSGGNSAVTSARNAYRSAKGDTGPNDSTFLNWWQEWGDVSGPNSLAANPQDKALLEALAQSGNAQAQSILDGLNSGVTYSQRQQQNQFGGAANNGGVVTGGNVTAPIASGTNSTAVQNTGSGINNLGDIQGTAIVTAPIGGNLSAISGDNSGAVINAPVTGPVTSIGGDVDAPVITGDVGGDSVVVGGDNTAPVITAPLTESVVIGGDTEDVLNVSGDVTAPIASGDDSIAQLSGEGGVNVGGDVSAPVVTAPIQGVVSGGDVTAPVLTGDITAPVIIPAGDILAPVFAGAVSGPVLAPTNFEGNQVYAPVSDQGVSAPISVGGDFEQSGNIITGNSGTINITDGSEEMFADALAANKSAFDSSLSFVKDALNVVAESKKDPEERISSESLKTVGFITAAVVALALFARKAA